jgi:ABC-type siderophore export system fused ATPase/permease subunit
MSVNVDSFENVMDTEMKRLDRIIQAEVLAFVKPDVDRMEVSQYSVLDERQKLMIPKEERGRLEKLRRKLLEEV